MKDTAHTAFSVRLWHRIRLDPVASLFYLFFALPLLYIPGHHTTSRSIRVFYMMAVTVLVFVVPKLRAVLVTNIRALGKWGGELLAVVILFMVVSSVMANQVPLLMLFGRSPEYMGILAWLSVIFFSLFFAGRVRELLFSKTTLLLMTLVLAGSLSIGMDAIWEGYRIPGLMMQATTMAMYAVLAVVIALGVGLQKGVTSWVRKVSVGCFCLAIAIIIFTQSRVGYVGLVIVLTYFATQVVHARKVLAGLLAAAVLAVTLFVTMGSGQYVQRMHAASVDRGITYRLDMYKVTGRDIIRHNLFIGNGPGALPISLNNIDVVPEDIAVTLSERYLFVSSHDLFLDISQYFGLFVGVTTLLACVLAFTKRSKNHVRDGQLQIAFVVLLLNAVCNTISPEITAVFGMVLFGLLMAPRRTASKHA